MIDNSEVRRSYTSQTGTVFREYNDGKRTMEKLGEAEKGVLDFVYVSDKKRIELRDELSRLKHENRARKNLEELTAKGRREKYQEAHGKIFYIVFDAKNNSRGGGYSSEITKIEPAFS